MWQELRQRLDEISQRLFSLVKIGRVAAVADQYASQVVQVQLGASQTVEIRKIGHYGFAYNPPVNSDAVVIALNGDTRNSVVIGTEYQAARPRELQPGEAALWDDQGQMVLISRSGIKIVSTGAVSVNGSVLVQGLATSSEGATGVFTTPTGQVITVQQGVITAIG